jgi:hypothetical protein
LIGIHHLTEILYPLASNMWMAALVFGYLEEKCNAVFDRALQKKQYLDCYLAEPLKVTALYPVKISCSLQRFWVVSHLQKWQSYLPKMQMKKELLEDYADLVQGAIVQLSKAESNHSCLVDNKNVIQGVSSFIFKDNQSSYVCITRLITAPWNLNKKTKESKGVGSALIENICYELFRRQGLDLDKPLSYGLIKASKIELGPIDAAFYRHLFFENVDQRWPPHTMVLEGENLLTFLRGFGGR